MKRIGSLWMCACALALTPGCQAKSQSPSQATSDRAPESASAMTETNGTTGSATTGSATTAAGAASAGAGTAGTAAARSFGGRIHRIEIAGDRGCLSVAERTVHVARGDSILWVSKAGGRVVIDINGTSPMVRGHFEITSRGRDGGTIVYDGAEGPKRFYYSVLPAACPTAGDPLAIVVDRAR